MVLFLQSLKKEVDWSGGVDDKSTGESSSDYARHPHDSVSFNQCALITIINRVEQSSYACVVVFRISLGACARTPSSDYILFSCASSGV